MYVGRYEKRGVGRQLEISTTARYQSNNLHSRSGIHYKYL